MNTLTSILLLPLLFPLHQAGSLKDCKRHLEQKREDEAILCIHAIYQKSNNVRHLRNIAFFYERAAKQTKAPRNHYYLEQAIKWYKKFLKTKEVDRYDRYELTVRIARLRKRIPYGTLTIVTIPKGATFSIRGYRFGKLDLQAPQTFRRLRPGEYKLSLELKGYKPESILLVLQPGKTQTKLIQLKQKSGFAEFSRKAGALFGRKRVATWIVLGVAGACLIGAASTGAVAHNNWNASYQQAQSSGPGRYDWGKTYQSAQDLGLASTVLWIGAGAALSAGVVLFFLEGRDTTSAPPPSSQTRRPYEQRPQTLRHARLRHGRIWLYR